MTPGEKFKMVTQVSGRSSREAQRTLLTFSSSPERHSQKEKERAVTPTRTELRFFVDTMLMDDQKRARELKGDLMLAAIFAEALRQYVERIDPEEKLSTRTRAPKRKPDARHVPAALARQTRTQAQGRCEYVDPKTGRRCESRTRLQVDHRMPFALGGPTEPGNLRMLCRSHKLLHAVDTYEAKKTGPYLRV